MHGAKRFCQLIRAQEKDFFIVKGHKTNSHVMGSLTQFPGRREKGSYSTGIVIGSRCRGVSVKLKSCVVMRDCVVMSTYIENFIGQLFTRDFQDDIVSLYIFELSYKLNGAVGKFFPFL